MWEDKLPENAHYGAANNFVPCLAHILHNCVLAFLAALSAAPADQVDIFDQQEILASTGHKVFKLVKESTGFGKTIAKI